MVAKSGTSNQSYSVYANVEPHEMNGSTFYETQLRLKINSKQGTSTFSDTLVETESDNGLTQYVKNYDGKQSDEIFMNADGVFIHGFDPNVKSVITNFVGTKEGCSFDLNGAHVVETLQYGGLEIASGLDKHGVPNSWGSYDATSSHYISLNNEFVPQNSTQGKYIANFAPDHTQKSIVKFDGNYEPILFIYNGYYVATIK